MFSDKRNNLQKLFIQEQLRFIIIWFTFATPFDPNKASLMYFFAPNRTAAVMLEKL